MVQYFPFRKELNQARGYLKTRGPKSKKNEQEYGPGKTDILVCEQCRAFYWHKSWHRNLEDYPALNQEKGLKFTTCPACQMIKDKRYEGQVLVQNAPVEMKAGIKKLAETYGQRATENDAMDRVISIEETGPIIEIKTTENQMAKRLAKKISEVYRGKFELSISNSKGEDTARARLTFKGK
ncbi:MAG: hypothetical protein HYT21_00210 [Candidatus Nealsonbacteria bacterium]|nr:hypothetical protein [Candidatus Nealsonbacteria bacterium]